LIVSLDLSLTQQFYFTAQSTTAAIRKKAVQVFGVLAAEGSDAQFAAIINIPLGKGLTFVL
jgi:hypothetical protein